MAVVDGVWAMWLVWQPHLALGVTRSLVVCVASEEQQTRRCGLDEENNAGYGVPKRHARLCVRTLHLGSDTRMAR
ncbi:hypothetical protein IQ250_06000 [Pseudanabaenaceae cyanobacterium LEGE 13415]|nr:hypothetical protein [Pseudanabaenaceae cyanobacterium LEGE 13415]